MVDGVFEEGFTADDASVDEVAGLVEEEGGELEVPGTFLGGFYFFCFESFAGVFLVLGAGVFDDFFSVFKEDESVSGGDAAPGVLLGGGEVLPAVVG